MGAVGTRVLAGLQRDAGEAHVWLGASGVNGSWHWTTGEGWNAAVVTAPPPRGDDHKLVATTAGDPQSLPAHWKLPPFIIEWNE